MIVVGVDPSLSCTGVALIGWDAGAVEDAHWATWRARSDALPKDLPRGEVLLATRRRLRTVISEALALVPPRVDLSVVENAKYGGKHTGLSDERAALRWWIVDQLAARGPVVVVSPTTRALLGGGSGSAPKSVVRAKMRERYPDALIPDDNVADAVALAEAGAHRLGFPVPYEPGQRRSHANVAWPVPAAAGGEEGQHG